MTSLKPVAWSGQTKSLDDLPDLILGGGVFNYQYSDSPHELPTEQVLKQCFDLGIRAIDTSAYYGPSEIILGDALKKLRADYPRESYFLCTKAGRVKEDVFDYSAESIRKSALRSLERFDTDYLDVLYIHDVEFNKTEDCLEAVKAAFELKKEGKVRNVGITGYPVEYLLYLAKKIKNDLPYGPLDIILSYCNFCIQNTKLKQYESAFKTEAGVGKLLNASPLSMSLLRAEPPKSFHPASQELKDAVKKAAEYTKSQGDDMSAVAVRFALENWNGPTVIGLSTVEEVNAAVREYWNAKDPKTVEQDKPLFANVQKILGDQMNVTWDSGIEHKDM